MQLPRPIGSRTLSVHAELRIDDTVVGLAEVGRSTRRRWWKDESR